VQGGEGGPNEPSSDDSGVPPVPPKTPVALVLDAFKRANQPNFILSGRDTAAIKKAFATGRPRIRLATEIVDAYSTATEGKWGPPWLHDGATVYRVIEYFDAYEKWVAADRPAPQPRNGRVTRDSINNQPHKPTPFDDISNGIVGIKPRAAPAPVATSPAKAT